MPHRYQQTESWPQFWSKRSPRTARGLLRLIRNQVQEAARNGIGWRSVIDALRPVTPQIWQSMPAVERRRFLRHARAYWEVHRHRIAPEVADVLSDLIQDGHIRICAGRVTRYNEMSDCAQITLQERQTGRCRLLRVDRVINCTGSENDCRRIDDSLITSLFAQGLARPDELFLGLDADENGALLNSTGIPSRFLYTLGPPRKGGLWETTAVPEIRAQASLLADRLSKIFSGRARSVHTLSPEIVA